VIPYGKQDINQADIKAVVEVLQSDFITQGPQVPLFEKIVSKYCGAKYSVAVNSATSALHIACLAIGLGNNDYLWTSPNSFVASANCGLYCNAKIDFVDIDKRTYNLSAIKLEQKLIQAKKNNKLPKVVIPVHFAGQSCDMKKIYSLSKEYGFKIVEDASHAIGGKYLNKSIGNCQYSDITVFSFHPVKIITTAEGGLATTNDAKLEEKMQLFRSHGITRNSLSMINPSESLWYYEQIDLGFNYRMTDLQAALGISQMKRLDEFISRRHVLQKRYNQLLDDSIVIKPYQDKDCFSSFHLYPVQININKSRQQVFSLFREKGVGVNVHYIPIHMQPYYQKLGFKQGDFPNAEAYYSNTISLPLYSSLSFESQDQVINITNKI